MSDNTALRKQNWVWLARGRGIWRLRSDSSSCWCFSQSYSRMQIIGVRPGTPLSELPYLYNSYLTLLLSGFDEIQCTSNTWPRGFFSFLICNLKEQKKNLSNCFSSDSPRFGYGDKGSSASSFLGKFRWQQQGSGKSIQEK